MAITKMTAVAFIEYHHYFLVLDILQMLVVSITSNCTV